MARFRIIIDPEVESAKLFSRLPCFPKTTTFGKVLVKLVKALHSTPRIPLSARTFGKATGRCYSAINEMKSGFPGRTGTRGAR
jgi:hypothetical protein